MTHSYTELCKLKTWNLFVTRYYKFLTYKIFTSNTQPLKFRNCEILNKQIFYQNYFDLWIFVLMCVVFKCRFCGQICLGFVPLSEWGHCCTWECLHGSTNELAGHEWPMTTLSEASWSYLLMYQAFYSKYMYCWFHIVQRRV